MFAADRDRFPFVDHPLGEATVQEIHLDLIRRSRYNYFNGPRVLDDLWTVRDLWKAVLFDRLGLDLVKLRDMPKDFYNVDTLYIWAASEAASHRLVRFGESWFADWVEVGSLDATRHALGSGTEEGRLVTMWWD